MRSAATYLLGLSIALAALSGCGDDCTGDVRRSLVLTLTLADGPPLDRDALHVGYVHESGSDTCEGSWPTFLCGSELIGPMRVVVSGPGIERTILDYWLSGDMCHVETLEDAVTINRL